MSERTVTSADERERMGGGEWKEGKASGGSVVSDGSGATAE